MNRTDQDAGELQVPVYSYKNPTRVWLHVSRRDWVIDKIRQYARSRPAKAMDAGFGSGVYLPVLAELFEEAVGLDSQQMMLDHARLLEKQHPNLRLVIGDLADCRLPSDNFDLIVCSEVVEHIGDSLKVLQELRRLLRPGGILILTTPQRWSLLELMARIAYLPGVMSVVKIVYRGDPVFDPGHINLMSQAEVARQLDAAGFSIVESYKLGAYVPVVADLMGESGLRFAKWLEPKLRRGPLSGLLWTQCYVTRKRS